MADHDPTIRQTHTGDFGLVVGDEGNAKGIAEQFKSSQPPRINRTIQALGDASTFAGTHVWNELATIKQKLGTAWSGSKSADEALLVLDNLLTDATEISNNTQQCKDALSSFQTTWVSFKDYFANDIDAGGWPANNDNGEARQAYKDFVGYQEGTIRAMPGEVTFHTPLDGQPSSPPPGGPSPAPPSGPAPAPAPSPAPSPAPPTLNPPPSLPPPSPSPSLPPSPSPSPPLSPSPPPPSDGPSYTPGPGPGDYPGPSGAGPSGYSPGGPGPAPGTGLDTGSQLSGLGPGGGPAPSGGLGPAPAPAPAGVGPAPAPAPAPAGVGPAGAGPAMGPGMMPGRSGGSDDEGELERSTWLEEEEDIWDGSDAPPDLT